MWKSLLKTSAKLEKPLPKFRFVPYYVLGPKPARLRLLQANQPLFRLLIEHSVELRAIDGIEPCLFAIDEIKKQKVEHLSHRISVGGVLVLEIIGQDLIIERGVAPVREE